MNGYYDNGEIQCLCNIYFKIYKYVKIQSNKKSVIIQIAMMEFGLGESNVMIVIFYINKRQFQL